MQKSSEIRQFQIDHLIKAPLATFDTIDLGDELPKAAVCSLKSERPDLCGNVSVLSKVTCDARQADKSGVEVKSEKRNQAPPRDFNIKKSTKDLRDENKSNTVHEDTEKLNLTAKNTQVNSASSYRDRDNEEGFENYVYISHIPAADLKEQAIVVGTKKLTEGHSVKKGGVQASSQPVTKIEPPPPPTLSRTSSFSSSSSDTDSDVQCRPLRNRRGLRVQTTNITDRIKDLSPVTLSPEIVDPSTITSPSKRKAYEKRLQRLQVKTSPIARPRSTTPINVVTLDEYVVLSSPEKSPNSPSVTEKLKITLPPDEFCVKPKSPRKSQWTKNISEEESCFEFNEELLFSHTRSALLVTEDGKLPDSPRRVLIPPTISPSSSPKLAPAAKLRKDLDGVPGSPKLVYIQSPDNENWATFPDTTDSGITESSNCQTASSTTDDIKNKSTNSDSTNPASYANSGVANSCDISNEEEEILTINIDSSSTGGKCGIDIVLSSSGSSNIPSPSTPEKPPTETPQSQNGETVKCRDPVPITITPSPTKEEELVEKVLSSSPRETYL